LDFDNSQLMAEVPLDFFFSFVKLMPDLSLCQELQERFSVCILGIRLRKMMKKSKISGAVVVAATIFNNFGGF
jgi:hypothetical protein